MRLEITGLLGGLTLIMINDDKGKLGEHIATKLWVNLKLTSSNDSLNKAGIDGYLDGLPVQIKYDATITKTGNLYHEIYEKSANRPEQDWRHSPNTAKLSIFITEDYAYKVSTHNLAMAERNLSLRQISPTSMGFLVPIQIVANCEKVKLNEK